MKLKELIPVIKNDYNKLINDNPKQVERVKNYFKNEYKPKKIGGDKVAYMWKLFFYLSDNNPLINEKINELNANDKNIQSLMSKCVDY